MNQRLETEFKSYGEKAIYLLLDGVRVGRALGSVDDLIGQAPEGAVSFVSANMRDAAISGGSANVMTT
jgi:hypothetical protein